MEKEFIPYKIALQLKELGFDEPCFGKWLSSFQSGWKDYELILEMGMNEEFEDNRNVYLLDGACSAPTFSQAFNFLLEKYNLYAVIIPTVTIHWTFKTMTIANGMINIPPYKNVDGNDYSSFKEAELACIEKLIQIVKNK